MSEFEKAPGALSDAGKKLVRETILGELQGTGRTFQQLWRTVNQKLGYERADANAPGYRATDYQLQILRRSNQIYCRRCGDKTLWHLKEAENE